MAPICKPQSTEERRKNISSLSQKGYIPIVKMLLPLQVFLPYQPSTPAVKYPSINQSINQIRVQHFVHNTPKKTPPSSNRTQPPSVLVFFIFVFCASSSFRSSYNQVPFGILSGCNINPRRKRYHPQHSPFIEKGRSVVGLSFSVFCGSRSGKGNRPISMFARAHIR